MVEVDPALRLRRLLPRRGEEEVDSHVAMLFMRKVRRDDAIQSARDRDLDLCVVGVTPGLGLIAITHDECVAAASATTTSGARRSATA